MCLALITIFSAFKISLIKYDIGEKIKYIYSMIIHPLNKRTATSCCLLFKVLLNHYDYFNNSIEFSIQDRIYM